MHKLYQKLIVSGLLYGLRILLLKLVPLSSDSLSISLQAKANYIKITKGHLKRP